MAWDDKYECMSLDELQNYQLQKLKETVGWVRERVPFYRRKFEALNISEDDIKTLDDVAKLPFTEKTDLRDNYPFDMCAVPMEEVARIHASSGTTGKPVTGPYTAEDLDQWAECVARNLYSYGVRKGDILQNSYGYGLFTGGLGLHGGATKLGCTVVPTSAGLTERQINLMRDFKSTVLSCTPSYALTITEKAQEMNVDIRKLPLRIGIFGAEPWTDEMCRKIENRMGITAMNIYGLTELCGPGIAYDCSEQTGMHINEDHFIAEIVDPQTLEPVGLEQKGELVFTAIRRRAMPLIRYRTKDITRLVRKECSCGRTFVKMERISGRTDDMLIISGVNVFPSQVEALLLDIKGLEPQYILIVRKKGYLDRLIVQVEAKKELYEDGGAKLSDLKEKVSRHIQGNMGISVDVEIVEPKTITRSEGKAVRVFDER